MFTRPLAWARIWSCQKLRPSPGLAISELSHTSRVASPMQVYTIRALGLYATCRQPSLAPPPHNRDILLHHDMFEFAIAADALCTVKGRSSAGAAHAMLGHSVYIKLLQRTLFCSGCLQTACLREQLGGMACEIDRHSQGQPMPVFKTCDTLRAQKCRLVGEPFAGCTHM